MDCKTDGYDEKFCSEESCDGFNKFKCPNESKCIAKTYRCDGDEEWLSLYPIFKCQYNNDESEIMCAKDCEKRNEFACPYAIGKANLQRLCQPFDTLCNIPESVSNLSSLAQNGYLWRCSPKYNQWIKSDRKCDKTPDCLFLEDESEKLCGGVSISMLLLLTFGLVIGTVVFSLCIKATGMFKPASDCIKCLSTNQTMLTDIEWRQIKIFIWD